MKLLDWNNGRLDALSQYSQSLKPNVILCPVFDIYVSPNIYRILDCGHAHYYAGNNLSGFNGRYIYFFCFLKLYITLLQSLEKPKMDFERGKNEVVLNIFWVNEERIY
jgi:hypothetical protein